VTRSPRADALVAAAETLDALAIDQGYVIDPFAAIDRLGLTLSIGKLENLLGAVVPGGTGGVLITSERSAAIQRYTAAHEIGHWILHEDQLQVDDETAILGRPSNEMERQAQLFAGYFLMPPALLNKAVSAYNLQGGPIAPEQVYRLGRDLDVSYEAAARRLRTARLLDDTRLREILAFGRMRAMQSASAGRRPADGLADMWDATSDEDVVSLVVEEHDEVFVGLPEQRLAGWQWLTAEGLTDRNRRSSQPRPRPQAPNPSTLGDTRGWSRENLPTRHLDPDVQSAVDPDEALDRILGRQDAAPAAVADDAFVAERAETPTQRRRRRIARAVTPAGTDTSVAVDAVGPLVGGNGVRTLIVRTAAPGEWNLQLYYAHAYDPHEAPLLTYELRLSIQPTPNTAFRARRLESDVDQRFPGDPDDTAEFEVA
jgi:Zn-dependent peptidase ImmA (M78 family)